MQARGLVSVFVATAVSLAAELPHRNFIDDYIFAKIRKDGVSQAGISSDAEFLRRVTLDLTGRLPEPEQVLKFVNDTDPAKREKWIDSLFPALPTMGVGRRLTEKPFLDRWAYFFSDLFR